MDNVVMISSDFLEGTENWAAAAQHQNHRGYTVRDWGKVSKHTVLNIAFGLGVCLVAVCLWLPKTLQSWPRCLFV